MENKFLSTAIIYRMLLSLIIKATVFVYLGILLGFKRTAFSLEFLGISEAGNADGFNQAARQIGGLTLQPLQEKPAYTSIAHLPGVCTACQAPMSVFLLGTP